MDDTKQRAESRQIQSKFHDDLMYESIDSRKDPDKSLNSYSASKWQRFSDSKVPQISHCQMILSRFHLFLGCYFFRLSKIWLIIMVRRSFSSALQSTLDWREPLWDLPCLFGFMEDCWSLEWIRRNSGKLFASTMLKCLLAMHVNACRIRVWCDKHLILLAVLLQATAKGWML